MNPDSGVGGSFAANIADVEVDPETGKVQILRFTVIQDAGRAIHPSYVEGQMQGGSVQVAELGEISGFALRETKVLGNVAAGPDPDENAVLVLFDSNARIVYTGIM